VDVNKILREFCSAVEQRQGQSLAQLFCKDGVYHDVFYRAFAGQQRIAEMIDKWFYRDADLGTLRPAVGRASSTFTLSPSSGSETHARTDPEVEARDFERLLE
jgi:hypothetical protein